MKDTGTRHHTRKHGISTEELEAKLGIHDIRHYAFFWKVFFKIRAQPLTAHDALLCHKY